MNFGQHSKCKTSFQPLVRWKSTTDLISLCKYERSNRVYLFLFSHQVMAAMFTSRFSLQFPLTILCWMWISEQTTCLPHIRRSDASSTWVVVFYKCLAGTFRDVFDRAWLAQQLLKIISERGDFSEELHSWVLQSIQKSSGKSSEVG